MINIETLGTYNFRHLECLQLHCFCFLGVPSFASLGLDLDFGDSGFLTKKKENRVDELHRYRTGFFKKI